MKPALFRYVRAESWADAVAQLDRHGDEAKVLAGGQTLVPAMNFRLARPAVLVDLNAIRDADRVDVENGELRIGALARHIRFDSPVCGGPLGRLLPRMSRHIAHVPIRMRGTFGGSLAHADPASEWCTLGATLDATVVIEGPAGGRLVGARDFFLSLLTTALAADEVVREIRLPVLGDGWRCGFREFSRRAGDFALALAVACIHIREGCIADARIGVGGVGAVPFRSEAAETVLAGQEVSPALFRRAGEAALEGVDALHDHHATAAYRCDLARVLVARALGDAAGTAAAGRRP